MGSLRPSNMKVVIKEFTNLRVPKDVVNYLCEHIEKFLGKLVEEIDDYSESIESKTLVLQEAGLSLTDVKKVCYETSTLRSSNQVLCRLKFLGEAEIARRVKSATEDAEKRGETTLGLRHFRRTEAKTSQIIERGQFLETNVIAKHIERNIYPRGVSLEAAEIAMSAIESRIDHALTHLAAWNAPEEYDGRYEELYETVISVGQVGTQQYLRRLVERAGELANGETIQAVHMMDAHSQLNIEEDYA